MYSIARYSLFRPGHAIQSNHHKIRRTPCLSSQVSHPSVIGSDQASYEVIATRLWVEKFVFKHSLCPWAGGVIAQKKIRYGLLPYSRATKRQSKQLVIEEAMMLCKPDNEINHTTTILAMPYHHTDFAQLLPSDCASMTTGKSIDFDQFLSFVEDIELLLESMELNDKIQVASFHPLYQFQGTDGNDDENWTNRSPFPAIHLLRTADVTSAINSYSHLPKGTDVIWQNNIAKMRGIGGDDLSSAMESIMSLAKETYETQKLT